MDANVDLDANVDADEGLSVNVSKSHFLDANECLLIDVNESLVPTGNEGSSVLDVDKSLLVNAHEDGSSVVDGCNLWLSSECVLNKFALTKCSMNVKFRKWTCPQKICSYQMFYECHV